jgi:hypothetical protein
MPIETAVLPLPPRMPATISLGKLFIVVYYNSVHLLSAETADFFMGDVREINEQRRQHEISGR